MIKGLVLSRSITVGETLIHLNTLQTKQQPEQWISPGVSAQTMAKVDLSANKVMTTASMNVCE